MVKLCDLLLKHLALTAITIGCMFLFIWYKISKKEVGIHGN